MKIDLKFLKSWGAYNIGETARFVPEIAQVLLQKGIAGEHNPAPLSQPSQKAGDSAGRPLLTMPGTDDKTKPTGK